MARIISSHNFGIITIISTTRKSSLLEVSLPSVFNQSTLPDYVYIVADSEENLPLDSITQLNTGNIPIKCILNYREKNLSGAMNTAFSEILGDGFDPEKMFIAILDDDDWWEDDYLKSCSSTVLQNGSDWIVSGIIRHESDSDLGKPLSIPKIINERAFLRTNPHLQGSNLFVRLSKILLAGGYDEYLPSTTDRDLCIRLLALWNIKIDILQRHLVHHLAFGHDRLSDPGSVKKVLGLERFYYKYKYFMDADDENVFSGRAKELFGYEPKLTGVSYASGEIPHNFPVLQDEHIDLVIGFILSDASYFKTLIRDAKSLNIKTKSVSAIVVSDNCGLNETVVGETAKSLAYDGIELKIVTSKEAEESAERGDLGQYYKDEINRKGIAFGRTVLHRFVYLQCIKYANPVAWIVDDDVSLNNIYWGTFENKIDKESFLNLIYKWKSNGISIVVGKVGGDPPVPIMSTIRTQMLDLYFNLKAVVSGNLDRFQENDFKSKIHKAYDFPAYFYDFPDKSFVHLETPIWKCHTSIASDINSTLKLLSKNASLILKNNTFRPAFYTVGEGDNGDRYYTSKTEEFGPVRGGNTLVFDIECLRDFTNSSPRSEDIPYRRGDTLWTVLNKRLGGRRPLDGSRIIISSPLMLVQKRGKDETPEEMKEKLVADTLGSAFVKSIDSFLFRKTAEIHSNEDYYDPLKFTDSEIKDIINSMENDVIKRTRQISLNSWRIRGLVQSIRSILSEINHSSISDKSSRQLYVKDISVICERVEELFSQTEIRLITNKATNFNKDNLIDFLNKLAQTSRTFGDSLPIYYSKSDIEEIKIKIREAFNSEELHIAGTGKEGIVLSDDLYAYKFFHYGRFAMDNVQTRFLEDKVLNKNFKGIAKLVSMSSQGDNLIFKEELVSGQPYCGGKINELVSLLNECKTQGIVIKNLAPKNIICNDEELKYVDIGRDMEPYTEQGYLKMCKRAYLTYRWHFRSDISDLFRKSNFEEDFPELFGFTDFLALVGQVQVGEISVPFVVDSMATIHHQKILDYGCGTGQIADELAVNNEVSVYDVDMSGFYKRHHEGTDLKILYREDLDRISEGGSKFDLVLVSLVLCTVGDDEVRSILSDARNLLKSGREIVLVICNPFHIQDLQTGTHLKIGIPGNYHDKFYYEKKMKITGNLRHDYHRPLSWYANELKKSGFHLTGFSESVGASFDTVSPGSEFLMIRAIASSPPEEYNVSLMIKASAMEWRSIYFQVRHIVNQLEGPEKFKEKFIVTDLATEDFARQYDNADVVLFKNELERLRDEGIVDSVLYASEDRISRENVSEKWFGLKCGEGKSMNKQPVLTTLQGFEYASSKYILQLDSDCIICRDGTDKSYLGEMVNVLENNATAITASFPICSSKKILFSSGNGTQKWRNEVRNCLIDKSRLFSLRPMPNKIDLEGKLELPWHRSLDKIMSSGPWDSYRGSLGNAFFIHVPNSLKKDFTLWYNTVKYLERAPPKDKQFEKVDLQSTDVSEVLESRNEEIIIIVKGRNTPIPKLRRCFSSLLYQDTQDFGVVFVDAASENGTDEYVRYLGSTSFGSRLTLFQNHTPLTSIENIFIAVRKICNNPQSIIVLLDADDALIGKNVLSQIRSRYINGADLTVGTMIRTDKQKNYPVNFENPRGNRGGNVWQHLRTFRKYLFDSIDVDDLKIRDKWIEEADDWAYMVPMVEMAENPELITDTIYFYEPSPEKPLRSVSKYEDTISRILAKKSYRKVMVN